MLTEIFNTVVNEYVPVVVNALETSQNSLFWDAGARVIGFGVTLALGYVWSQRRARAQMKKAIEALTSKEIVGGEAVITETHYAPSGQWNEQTGGEFYDQRVRAMGPRIKLSKVFNDLYGEQILGYFTESLKHCTPEEPVIFQHLKKVIPPEHFESVFTKISSGWKTYLGTHYARGARYNCGLLHEREKYEERNAVGLLVYEKGASSTKQFRIIVVHEDQMKAEALPDPANTRFQVGGSYVFDPEHGQAERIKMHHALVKALQDKVLHDAFCFSFPTGNVICAPKISEKPPCEPHKTACLAV